MRLFQSGYFYPAYLPRFRQLSRHDASFAAAISTLLHDRTDAAHILEPILSGDGSAFYTANSDPVVQRMWARENNLPARSSADDILLAQIEAHRTEVFYDMSPMLHEADFIRRLPGSVKRRIAWLVSPDKAPLLDQYDLVVGNFPKIMEGHARRGCRTAYFSPAHDPVLDEYAASRDRPVDVIFVGAYSRHHRRRNELLLGLTELAGECNLALHLFVSRRTLLAETPLGALSPIRNERRAPAIRKIARGPLFGRDFYAAMSRAKIAINGSGEIAGNERGNMRCFEAMGCRNLLLADAGIYPEGMEPGRTLVTYESTGDALAQARALLKDPERLERIADAGAKMVATRYSKARQWHDFQVLAG